MPAIRMGATRRRAELTAIVKYLRKVGFYREIIAIAHPHADTDAVHADALQFARLRKIAMHPAPLVEIRRDAGDDPDDENTLATAVLHVGNTGIDWSIHDRKTGDPAYRGTTAC